MTDRQKEVAAKVIKQWRSKHRCTVCQRPEAENAPEAWTDTPSACPPTDLSAKLRANAHPGHESDRDEAAHTLATAQAEISALKAALARCEEARDAMALQVGDRDRRILRLESALRCTIVALRIHDPASPTAAAYEVVS